MLRREALCPDPQYCPDVEVLGDGLPCDVCPIAALDLYLASPWGRRFIAVLELDFALRVGFNVNLDEVSCIDFGLLKLLDEERHRYEKEEIDKMRNKR